MTHRILLVEDDQTEGRRLRGLLEGRNYQVDWTRDVEQAKSALESGRYSLVLADYQLPDGTGFDLYDWMRQGGPGPPVVFLSAYASVPRAVEALKKGAGDFLEKPIDTHQLYGVVREHLLPRPDPGEVSRIALSHGIVYTRGSPMESVVNLALRVAAKNSPVFISGESGTGKELLARLLHGAGNRSKGKFVAVNCAAVPEQLFESELFGHVAGAFTGAVGTKKGKVVLADRGTLFLDEIGDLPLFQQSKLLRVLQERTVCPLGGDRDIPVDFRLICATHRDLFDLVKKGLFREDLYYRVRVVDLAVPALRERPGDIPSLISALLSRQVPREISQGREPPALPRELLDYSWPGNIRELKNAVERYQIYRDLDGGWQAVLRELKSLDRTSPAAGTDIPAAEAPAHSGQPTGSIRKPSPAEIREALKVCGFNRDKTARYLGISRRNLQYKLAQMKSRGEFPGTRARGVE